MAAVGDVVSWCEVNQVMMSEQLRPGVCVVEVWVELLSCGQVEVRAQLSEGSFLHLIRTDGDLARMMKRLVDSFPDDKETLSSKLLTGEMMQTLHLSVPSCRERLTGESAAVVSVSASQWGVWMFQVC